jgi:hypothetical protein
MSATSTTSRRPRDPLMLAVVGCAAVFGLLGLCFCSLAVAAGVAYRYSYPPPPSDPAAMLAVADDQVAALRGIDFTRPVSFNLMTSAEMRAKVEEEADEEWSVEDARDGEIALEALDFLDRDEVDLHALMTDLEASQIIGYYDPDEQTLYVISDAETLSPMDRTVLAHELTHALQDQHFDLGALGDEEDEDEGDVESAGDEGNGDGAGGEGSGDGADMDSEARLAFRSLVEGDASLLESQYTSAHIAPHEYLSIGRQLWGRDWSALDKTPQFILDVIGFPYAEGKTFVEALYAEGGWPAVDAAYDDPPRSTEEILHPERYWEGAPPRSVPMLALTDTLGSGWRWVDEDIVGEFGLRQHIATAITPTLAAIAAEGWGGDSYVVFHHDEADETVLLLRTVWDTPEDADEFLNLYSLYLSARFMDLEPYIVNFDEDESRLCWQIEGDARCLWRDGDDAVSILRAPNPVAVGGLYDAVLEADRWPP